MLSLLQPLVMTFKTVVEHWEASAQRGKLPKVSGRSLLTVSYLNYMWMYLHIFVNTAGFLTSASASPSMLALSLPTRWKGVWFPGIRRAWVVRAVLSRFAPTRSVALGAIVTFSARLTVTKVEEHRTKQGLCVSNKNSSSNKNWEAGRRLSQQSLCHVTETPEFRY